MSDTSGSRPSLRLIAGELLSTIAQDVDDVAEIALGGRPMGTDPGAEMAEPPESIARKPRIAVVGGGIAGLSAAWSLINDRGVDAEIIVFESENDVGGKLKLGQVDGITVDAGAESLLAIRPEAVALAKAVGLAASITHPATTQASLLSGGSLHPLPTGLISGVPTDLRALAASDILSTPGLLRIPLDHLLPKTSIDVDVSIGDYVAARLGREVVDRLVEPMVGGVYAGRAEDLSLEMTMPALFRLARRERSLLTAAREARATGSAPSGSRRGPIFAGITGGVGRLGPAVADRLRRRGVRIERDSTVTGVRRVGKGWRLIVNQAGEARRENVDAVVLAVPAMAAAKVLRQANPLVASTLDTIDYASVALVTYVFNTAEVPPNVQGSGFLVPPVEGHAIKAATYSSRKWTWVAKAGAGAKGSKRGRGKRPSRTVVRVSLGRYGEAEVLQRDNAELAALGARDLHAITGLPSTPVASLVTRWGGALPQYTVGHRSRVAAIREGLIDTPGIAVCGAAYDGVGIAACIGSAQFAAGQVAGYLLERGQWAHG